MLSIDLYNAFDCVQHDHLLYNMSITGFHRYLLKVVDLFLSEGKFSVAIGLTCSDLKDMKAGVPQGAVPVRSQQPTSRSQQIWCWLSLWTTRNM